MAAGYLSKPGRKYGPCIGNCTHSDCAASRKIASSVCRHCGKPIGYDVRFYDPVGETPVHAVCEEVAIEKEQASIAKR
jgi:hypothetical protein